MLDVWEYSTAESPAFLSEGTSTEELTSESETVTVNETMYIKFSSADSAAFLKTQSTTIDGVDYQLGEPWAVSFENSAKGRKSLAEIIPNTFFRR